MRSPLKYKLRNATCRDLTRELIKKCRQNNSSLLLRRDIVHCEVAVFVVLKSSQWRNSNIYGRIETQRPPEFVRFACMLPNASAIVTLVTSSPKHKLQSRIRSAPVTYEQQKTPCGLENTLSLKTTPALQRSLLEHLRTC
jgi:hypothetical protein